MSDLPKAIEICEKGPREGLQIEPGPIPTQSKIDLIDALSETGIKQIQVVSFVNARRVPGWADAEAVVEGFRPRPGVRYSPLWLNEKGLERALHFKDRLSFRDAILMSADSAELMDVATFASLPAVQAGRVFTTEFFFPSSYGLSAALLADVVKGLDALGGSRNVTDAGAVTSLTAPRR